MTCPHCESPATTKRQGPTSLGSRRFRCRSCGRRFNERSGTPLNDLQYPTDGVLLAVLRRLRYTLSCRDMPRCGSSGASPSPPRRSGSGSAASRRASLSGSERSGAARPAAPGTWTRPPGRSPGTGALSTAPSTARGVLRDSMRSAHRDKHAARRFLRRLVEVTERKPERVTTDPHPPYRRAIRWILGRKVRHRCNRYLNTLAEQSQRAIKPRDDPLLGCGSFASAARCCSAFDALRQYVRVGQRGAEWVPLAEQRRLVVQRWRSLIAEMTAA